jgi:uncharacterized protein (TIGR01244 family)
MDLRRLDDATFVAGQIAPEEVADLAARGVTTIVNNRPDGEEYGQPPGAEIEAAAKAAGLDYHFIPVGGGLSHAQIEAMAAALGEARGPVLAFCRSGTRSTLLWALARSRLGDSGEALAAKAEAAGYDLAPIRDFLDRR